MNYHSFQKWKSEGKYPRKSRGAFGGRYMQYILKFIIEVLPFIAFVAVALYVSNRSVEEGLGIIAGILALIYLKMKDRS
jgi:hypothetical protein